MLCGCCTGSTCRPDSSAPSFDASSTTKITHDLPSPRLWRCRRDRPDGHARSTVSARGAEGALCLPRMPARLVGERRAGAGGDGAVLGDESLPPRAGHDLLLVVGVWQGVSGG